MDEAAVWTVGNFAAGLRINMKSNLQNQYNHLKMSISRTEPLTSFVLRSNQCEMSVPPACKIGLSIISPAKKINETLHHKGDFGSHKMTNFDL